MAPHARNKGISRRRWLLAGLAFPLFSARSANSLSVSVDGDMIHPVAPNLRFLTDRTAALDRLKDGAAVTFVYRLQLFTIDRSIARADLRGKFVVSYAIWEDLFQVNFQGRTKSGLTAPQAEAWCVENMSVSASGLARDVPFYLRLELRTASGKELSGVADSSGISIVGGLVELFSRKPRADEPHWGPFESGPLRLSDLSPRPVRGARSG
jgi:hypothetical protein